MTTEVTALALDARYPDGWEDFVGQEPVKRQLQVACASAKLRGERVGHTLFASGVPGIGKTTLARLMAQELGRGMKEVSGKMTLNEVRIVLAGLVDGDLLFIDEIHRLVQGGKGNAEWLLHLMTDAVLMGPVGPEPQPDITIVGATTDTGRLPDTILGRFDLRPTLEPYTAQEAMHIGVKMASRVLPTSLPFPTVPDFHAIALAANNNPRTIWSLLSNLRDLALVDPSIYDTENERYNLTEPLGWLGLTPDGLTATARRYLVILLTEFSGAAGERAMVDRLQEPGGLQDTERLLMDKGLIAKKPTGRVLTGDGIRRAQQELQ